MPVLYNNLTAADIVLTFFKRPSTKVRLNKDIASCFSYFPIFPKQLYFNLPHFLKCLLP